MQKHTLGQTNEKLDSLIIMMSMKLCISGWVLVCLEYMISYIKV